MMVCATADMLLVQQWSTDPVKVAYLRTMKAVVRLRCYISYDHGLD